MSNTSNQVPLRFNPVCRGKVDVTSGRCRVRRCPEDYCDGMAISSRPVRTNEVISFGTVKCDFNIAFGFTRYDPSIHTLPVTNADSYLPGGWLSFIGPKFCSSGIWYFYLNDAGDVHIGVDGKDERVYFAELYFHDNDHWAFVEVWRDTELKFMGSSALELGPPTQRTPRELLLTASAAAICPTFHEVHGEQVVISYDGYVLQSRSSDHDRETIAFSNRPININEVVRILFINVGQSSNFIAFGFTKHNPASSKIIPDYIYYHYDYRRRGATGYWANYLEKNLCVEGNILDFHVNASGDIQYGINERDVGIICARVEMGKPLWVVVQICPNSMIKFIPYRCGAVADDHRTVGVINNAYTGPNIDQISTNGTVKNQNQAGCSQKSVNIESRRGPDNLNHQDISPSHQATAPAEVDTECIICSELPANTAFFPCGHLCTCYKCAEETWRGRGNSQCPICRAGIQQILRTYR